MEPMSAAALAAAMAFREAIISKDNEKVLQKYEAYANANTTSANTTSTNVKIGKQPRLNDALKYFIFGTNSKMTLLMADRLAAHGQSDTQLFVEVEFNLTQLLGKKNNTKNDFSN